MFIAPKTWDNNKLQHFEKSHKAEIENLAVGLSDQEIYDYYGIEDVNDLPEYDKLFLTVTIKRGRLVAKQNATHHLFEAMKSKDALPASLAYLTRFGHSGWGEDKGTGAKVPTTLKIVLEDA